MDEATAGKYGFSSNLRTKDSTRSRRDYTRATDGESERRYNECGTWWLQSPSLDRGNQVWNIDCTGTVGQNSVDLGTHWNSTCIVNFLLNL